MMIMLSDVVAQVESSNNPLSMRYEPAWVPHNEVNAQKYAANGWIDEPTAAMICKTSWGKYQIMGDNLYGTLQYTGTIVDFMTNTLRQLRFFQAFLRGIGFSDGLFGEMSSVQILDFAEKYNGNGPAYAQALQRAYKELGG